MTDVVMFSISNFGSKILTFLMVPLYTHILTTEEYGIADLLLGTINILFPVLTLAITEATLRFLLDDDSDHGKVLGGSLVFIFLSFLILVAAGFFVGFISQELAEYWGYFLAMYLSSSLQSCLSNYTRGTDRTRLFAIKGIVHTALLVTLNLFFLLVLKIGLNGYLLSLILSDAFSVVFMAIGTRIWEVIPQIRLDKHVIRNMLHYSVPMIPTIIAWWVMQMSDKYVLIAYSGLAVSGIYSVAYRIPSVLSIVSSIFNQAWQISAVKSLNDADHSRYVTQVYHSFFVISLFLCSGLICASEFLGSILYAKDYYIAWTYVPVLLVAYFFSGLSGVMASIYTAMKRTQLLFRSTLCGALLNLVLNLLLIPYFGAMGAAATTAVGFFATFSIRSIYTKKFFDLKLNGIKEGCMALLLVVQAVVMSANFDWKYFFNVGCLIIILIIYQKDVGYFVASLKSTLFKFMGRKHS